MRVSTTTTLTTLSLLSTGLASSIHLQPRQASCPPIHIFGARETTVSPGYGTAGVVVNLVLNSNPGSTAEPIVYPACGGQASCGGATYAQSAVAGTAAVASQVNAFNAKCPSTKLVLVGYSQVSAYFCYHWLFGGGSWRRVDAMRRKLTFTTCIGGSNHG